MYDCSSGEDLEVQPAVLFTAVFPFVLNFQFILSCSHSLHVSFLALLTWFVRVFAFCLGSSACLSPVPQTKSKTPKMPATRNLGAGWTGFSVTRS